jgi:hypothetical protein
MGQVGVPDGGARLAIMPYILTFLPVNHQVRRPMTPESHGTLTRDGRHSPLCAGA